MDGYANWATWNCALWLNNDEGLYNLALSHVNMGYASLVEELKHLGQVNTPDGAPWAEADHDEMNGVLAELAGD